MQFAITVFLFAMVLSGCAPAAHTRADKESPSPSPEPDNANLSPEQQRYKQAFAKMITDGHVNNVCQDLKGQWEMVEGAEEFRVCRTEQGFMSAGPGYVEVLETWKNKETGGGLLMPVVFDCAGRRWYHDQKISYDSTGTIKLRAPVALGGEWASIKPASQADVVRDTVCQGAIK